MSQKAKVSPCSKTDWTVARLNRITLLSVAVLLLPWAGMAQTAHDPGVRTGPPGAGGPISGLNANQQAMFSAGMTDFMEIDSVKGTVAGTGAGLGPRFNAEGCAQCHAAPAMGGSSPAVDAQGAA